MGLLLIAVLFIYYGGFCLLLNKRVCLTEILHIVEELPKELLHNSLAPKQHVTSILQHKASILTILVCKPQLSDKITMS